MDELLNKVAELRGMPASLVKRSAQAKADKTGTTLEAILQEWAGEDDATSSAAPEAAAASDVAGEPSSAPETAAAGAPTAITTDYLVQLASEAKRMPPKLILTSAQARAEHSGSSLDEVLAGWAGTDLKSLEAAAAETPTAAPAAAAPAAAAPPPPAPEPEPAPAAAEPAEPAAPAAPVAAAATGAAVALTMDQLLEKVAEVKGMPAPLAKRSAEARSKKTGEPVEAVLAEWAGIDPASVSTAPTAPTPEAAPEPEPAPAAAAPVAAAAAGALTMDQLLEKVAEVKGMPAPLAKRSAEARSKKTGEPVEAVLAEWAGIDPASVSTAPAAAAPAAAAPAAAAQAEAPAVEEPKDDVEIIEAEPVDVSDIADTDDEPKAKRGGYPIWLAAAFILIPLLAVAYILVSPNGPDCGSGGQLLVDPATGEAVNCDGSQYGVVAVDHFAAGGALYQQCVACHSNDGSGGVGPAFSSGAILTTFPEGSCADQIEWVTVGTSGWPDPTYGATEKPVGGVGLMPAFGASLTEEQVAQVVLYERVAFGGQDAADAEADCGLVEADGASGDGADS